VNEKGKEEGRKEGMENIECNYRNAPSKPEQNRDKVKKGIQIKERGANQ